VFFMPVHQVVQGKWDLVGMRCAPCNDAFKLGGIVGNGADFDKVVFDDLRVSHNFQDGTYGEHGYTCWNEDAASPDVHYRLGGCRGDGASRCKWGGDMEDSNVWRHPGPLG
jgi:hypothetical protein